MKRKKKLVLALTGLGLAALAFSSFYWPFPKARLSPAPVVSFSILDRNNTLLREVLSDEGGRCRWLGPKDVSPWLTRAVVAAEDKTFFRHGGVDPYAVLRAFAQNLRSRKVVSGASTITQQLVRNIYHSPRSVPAKVFEAWVAVRLEHSLSKNEILLQYLNRIPFGNQAYGAEAAARLYFGKPAAHLDLAESAFLAALPRSPSLLSPYRSFRAAKAKQESVLRQMRKMGFIGEDDLRRSLAEKLAVIPDAESFRAPHFCDFVLAGLPLESRRGLGGIRTTLDATLQGKVETLLRGHLDQLRGRGISNGAAVVLDNGTGDVLALVGSRDFFDPEHDGQVNGALSLRQPGSAMKPFTYALALEAGWTAASVIEDSMVQFPTDGGFYLPKNYDRRYHGPVRMRGALACSYNIPAVSILEKLGTNRLFLKLKAIGFDSLRKDSDYYGLGLTLGNGEVTLLELVRAYAALCRGGSAFRERTVLAAYDSGNRDLPLPARPPASRVFSPQAAYIITDILADKDARVPSFGYRSPLSLPFPAAAKTGTSKDFRDNWTVGYTPRYTVGVWVGNFDGTPMANVSGITGCGPLFRDIMLLLEKDRDPLDFPVPPGLTRTAICPLSGLRPNARCPGAKDELFIAGSEPAGVCGLSHQPGSGLGPLTFATAPSAGEGRFKIISPQEGDIFKLDPILRRGYQSLTLRVRVPSGAGIETVTWWVNGKKLGRATAPFSAVWGLEPGSYVIKAVGEGLGRALESPAVRITVVS